ncbi:MAG: winged helix-turn-helix transcriptional regulator [Asgard group archaeon]|nr:winged helix-turn-helix transcriptional regulator [Asgard group archaeon]
MMFQTELAKIADIFKAFADPTRLRLIRLLASNMEEKLSVSDLAKKLSITQPAATQHLNILKNIGILYSNKERPRIFYYLNLDELKKQKTLLDQFYDLAFTKCDLEGQCETCQNREFCDSIK